MHSMKTNRRSRRRWTGGLLAATLIAAACSGGDDSVTSDTEPVNTEAGTGATDDSIEADPAEVDAVLADVAFTATSAELFDTIEVTGWDGDPSDLDLAVVTDAGDVYVPLLIDGDLPRFSALHHIGDPFTAGPVTYRLRAADAGDTTITVDTAALEPAPGAFGDFLVDLESAIDASAVEFGSSAAELRALTIDDTPPLHLGQRLALAYLDDGSGSDLTSGYESLADEDRELLDAVFGRLDTATLLTRPVEPQGFAGPAPAAPTTTTSVATPVISSFVRQAGSNCLDLDLKVKDAKDLAKQMTEAKVSTLDKGDVRRKVLDDISTFATVAGFLPTAGPIAGLAGAGFVTYEVWQNAQAAMLPSAFTELTFDADTADFTEDFQAAGTWSNVNVTATSKGWQADGDIAKFFLAWLGPLVSIKAGFDGFEEPIKDLALNTGQVFRDNVVNSWVSQNQQDNGAFFASCAQTWTVDVTGQPWTSGDFVLDRFTADSVQRTYTPVPSSQNLPVEDVLQVEVQRSQFGGAHVFAEQPVTIQPIDVDTADEIFVDNPGDEFDYFATIDHATDRTLTWDADAGSWAGEATVSPDENDPTMPSRWRRPHVTPSSESAFPYVISVESSSRTGFRSDGDPPRVDTTVVRLRDLIITPSNARIPTEGSIQFEARNRNGDLVDVAWTATGGEILVDGTYLAGRTTGVFEVTASDRAAPDITATVPVEIIDFCDAEDLVGEWRVREADFLSQIGEALGGQGDVVYASGQYLITLGGDGRFEGRRQQLKFQITIQGQAADITIDTTELGTWTVDAETSTLTIDEESSNGTVSIEVDGIALPGGSTQQVSGAAFGGSGSYECDGDVLTLTVTQQGITVVSKLDRLG